MVYFPVGRRPTIKFGQRWRNGDQRGSAHEFPPTTIGGYERAIEPGTLMNPVVGYLHTPRSACILVSDYDPNEWVIVWESNGESNEDGDFRPTADGMGTYFAHLERPTHSLSNLAPSVPRNGELDDDGSERMQCIRYLMTGRLRGVDALRAEGVGDEDPRPSSSRGSPSRSPRRRYSAHFRF